MIAIPPRIHATIRRCLHAMADLERDWLDLHDAQRNLAACEEGLVWLSEQELAEDEALPASGLVTRGHVAHEGQRWGPYGANGHKDQPVRSVGMGNDHTGAL